VIAAEEQKAYNYAFGIVRSMHKMLGFVVHPQATKDLRKFTAKLPQQVADHLDSAAEGLEKLYRRTGDKVFFEVAPTVRKCSATAQAMTSATTLSDVHRSVNEIRNSLQDAITDLEQRSPIRYKLWWFNPKRYYPAKFPD
jgi:hypothetical protein